MASDDKPAKANTTKADSTPAKETPAKKAPVKETPVKETPVKDPVKDKASEGAGPSTAEGGQTEGAAPANYSRGEGQKPVTQAYKDNWDSIFKKSKKKK